MPFLLIFFKILTFNRNYYKETNLILKIFKSLIPYFTFLNLKNHESMIIKSKNYGALCQFEGFIKMIILFKVHEIIDCLTRCAIFFIVLPLSTIIEDFFRSMNLEKA